VEDNDEPPSGRRSLKKYELTNLLFFLVLIVALGVVVTFVFRHYGTRNMGPVGEAEWASCRNRWDSGSDVGMFYLGADLSETKPSVPQPVGHSVTDDGFLKELFSLPGVEEITVGQEDYRYQKKHLRLLGADPGRACTGS